VGELHVFTIMNNGSMVLRTRKKNLPPDDSNVRPCDFPLGAVYICYTLWTHRKVGVKCQGEEVHLIAHLSEVELSILLGRDTFNLEEGGVGAGITLAPLVTEYTSFGVESVEEIKTG
jgi:hypothetical protein